MARFGEGDPATGHGGGRASCTPRAASGRRARLEKGNDKLRRAARRARPRFAEDLVGAGSAMAAARLRTASRALGQPRAQWRRQGGEGPRPGEVEGDGRRRGRLGGFFWRRGHRE
jgi:hypothetical protein